MEQPRMNVKFDLFVYLFLLNQSYSMNYGQLMII